MSRKIENVRNAAAAGGILVAACAACCAPLLIAPLTALLAAGGLGLALVGQIALGILVLSIVGAYIFLRRRAALASKLDCECGASKKGKALHSRQG